MSETADWKTLYENAYVRNHTNNFAAQEEALKILSDRIAWLEEEHAAWARLGESSQIAILKPIQRIRAEMALAELNDATRCLQHIRYFHQQKGVDLRQQNEWIQSRILTRAPLAQVARYELERHKQAEDMKTCLDKMNFENPGSI